MTLEINDPDGDHSGEMDSNISCSLPGVGNEEPANGAWKLMVIDDDVSTLSLTRLILNDFSYEQRGLQFIEGRSGTDARRLIREHGDTAVMLLDVMMETDTEGLEVVRYIREELKNPFVRIILRTGQPGYAPEDEVTAQYDINDYKNKARLSRQDLVTSVTACLRSYRELRTLDRARSGLKQIISATGHLMEYRSMKRLATGILTQLAALVTNRDSCDDQSANECFAASTRRGKLMIYAAFGRYEADLGNPVLTVVDEALAARVRTVMAARKSQFAGEHFFGYFRAENGVENLIYLRGSHPLSAMERELIDVFSTNIASAFENLFLHRELINTQRDITFTLGEVIEVRSGEAGQHVRRVAEGSRLLATLAGLSETDVERLWLVSPMHDLGKIGIPDSILNKPGGLSKGEFELVKTHTEIGSRILSGSSREDIRSGGIVCAQHHEHWDGGGYPLGLAGEGIHVFARITALIDVFDALTHERVYKKAWSVEKALAFIREQSGKQFDPKLVDLFLDNVEEFLEIRQGIRK